MESKEALELLALPDSIYLEELVKRGIKNKFEPYEVLKQTLEDYDGDLDSLYDVKLKLCEREKQLREAKDKIAELEKKIEELEK